jgi:hypothetical protein
MKERPILFSTPMVKVILDGRKTMTRRVIKPQFKILHALYPDGSIDTERIFRKSDWRIHCPYGQVGDRLWIRETFAPCQMLSGKTNITYKADGGKPPLYLMADGKEIPCHWKPSIFMPRWASRITLEITNIRVEKLKEITHDDAVLEGCYYNFNLNKGLTCKLHPEVCDTATVHCFANLWDSINAKRGYSWESNPWVWVISYRLAGEGK